MKKHAILLTALILVAGIALAQQPANTSDKSTSPGLTPASPLYGIEMFVESIEVRVAGMVGGNDLKAKALANNADERITEANSLIERNKSEEATKALEKYSQTLNQSQGLAERSQDSDLKQKIDNVSSKNAERLRQVKDKVPEQGKEAVERAIEQSNRQVGPPEETPGNSRKPSQEGNSTVPGTPPSKNDSRSGNSEKKIPDRGPNTTAGPENRSNNSLEDKSTEDNSSTELR